MSVRDSPMSPDTETTPPPSFTCLVRMPSNSSPIDRSSSPLEPEESQMEDTSRRDR